MTIVGIVERIEGRSFPIRAARIDLLNAEIRIENPLPDETGDDEGQGEGIEQEWSGTCFRSGSSDPEARPERNR
jgi:hypothetical protein